MQTFFIVTKSIGDFTLPLAGLIVGICTVSPSFTKWLLQKEQALKASPLVRRILGTGLIAFSAVYLLAVIEIQLTQSKEQSPLYQHQLSLRHHAYQLADELSKLASNYETNLFFGHPDERMSKKIQYESYYGNRLGPRIDSMINRLDEEGLHTNSLENVFVVFPGANELRSIARDIKSLAAHLPKATSN